MDRNAIYFPYINVPKNSWFLRILLYWDKVQSIVPYEFANNINNLDPFMQDVVDAGLVNPIIPSQYIYKIPNFENTFMQYIENQLLLRNKANINFHTEINYTKIHLEKIGDIGYQLYKLGIAKHLDYPWYEVESWAANSFMSYLAASLGNIAEINASPITNNLSNIGITWNGQPFTAPNNLQIRKKIRDSLLTILLPEPMIMPRIDEIVKFKTKNKDQLNKCRDVIEECCIEISQITDRTIRNEKKFYIIKKMEDEVAEIDEAMKSEWQKTIFKVLIPFTIAELSFITANPVSIIVGGLSLLQAIYSGVELRQENIKLNNKPIAYIAKARRLII